MVSWKEGGGDAGGVGVRSPDWIGNLPSGWRVLRLRHTASVANSNVDKKSDDNGGSCKTPKTSEFLSNSRPKFEGVPGSLLVK
jgi:hypothetical protein